MSCRRSRGGERLKSVPFLDSVAFFSVCKSLLETETARNGPSEHGSKACCWHLA